MKKILRIMFITALSILCIWTALTIWAEIPKGDTIMYFGSSKGPGTALIVYNPDPFYNLDEQVCSTFAQQLAEHGIYTTVATVKAAKGTNLNDKDFDLYVFCANTYNWRPDWPTSGFVKKIGNLNNKNAVAITLGSGSTKESQAAFEKQLKNIAGVFFIPKPTGCGGQMMKTA